MIRRLALLPALAIAAPALAAEGVSLTLDAIEIRDGVTADMHVRVYANDRVPCRSGAFVAIHGATATARSLEPLAQAIAAAPPGGRPVCHVITVDLPGHGESPPPVGALMGDLTVQDYAAGVVGLLKRLPDEGYQPIAIAGHSMGGLVVQLAQQRLLDEGSSLADLGVARAVLFAPAINGAVPWTFRDSGAAEGLVAFFSITDPIFGDVLALPPFLIPSLFFGRRDGTVASTALTGEEVIALGWTGFESVAAMQSMFGLAPYDLPSVQAGAFAEERGTRLAILAFEEDDVIFVEDLPALFTHLTGKDASDDEFLVIEGEDAVHGLPQSDPEALLEAIRGRVSLL